jgi:GNAT superfamily N-acetyltransferase
MAFKNNSQIYIRESKMDDIPLILSFIKELAEFEKLSDQVSVSEKILKDSLFGSKRYAEVFIAEYENKPAGQVLFFHNFSTFKGKPGIYIEDLYVRPQFRGQGIGKALLKYMIELAKKRNCSRVEWVVLNWNKPAIDFYKRMGAVPMNDWALYRISENNF